VSRPCPCAVRVHTAPTTRVCVPMWISELCFVWGPCQTLAPNLPSHTAPTKCALTRWCVGSSKRDDCRRNHRQAEPPRPEEQELVHPGTLLRHTLGMHYIWQISLTCRGEIIACLLVCSTLHRGFRQVAMLLAGSAHPCYPCWHTDLNRPTTSRVRPHTPRARAVVVSVSLEPAQATCATNGEGLYEGLDWISSQLKHTK
jgi:hypothetical protein